MKKRHLKEEEEQEEKTMGKRRGALHKARIWLSANVLGLHKYISSGLATGSASSHRVYYLMLFIPLLPVVCIFLSSYFGFPTTINISALNKQLDKAKQIELETLDNKNRIDSLVQTKIQLTKEIESHIAELKQHNNKIKSILDVHVEYFKQRKISEEEIVGNEFVKSPVPGELQYLMSVNFKQMTRKRAWLVLFCWNMCHEYVARWQVIAKELENVMVVGLVDDSIDVDLSEDQIIPGKVAMAIIPSNGKILASSNEMRSCTETLAWVHRIASSDTLNLIQTNKR